MGRPIKQSFIGNRNVGGIGGEGLASITLGPTNDSSGYTAADSLTIGAPEVFGGVQAVATVLAIKPTGALTTATAYNNFGGSHADVGAIAFTGVTDKSTESAGTGAIWTLTFAGGQTNLTDLTITLTTDGSGFILAEEVTIDGADIGGITTTNDMTFDVITFVAGTNDCIDTLAIATAGTGYTAIPTITAATGSLNTLTLTGVLSTSAVGTIVCTAFLEGGSDNPADIEAQKGEITYRVTTSDGTGECSLGVTVDGVVSAHNPPNAAGEMQIIANDSGDGVYSVVKLYNNTVILEDISGTPEFAEGVRVEWAKDGVAVLNVSVSIT